MSRTSIYIDGGPFTDAIRGSGLSMDFDLMALLHASFPHEDFSRVSFVTSRTPAFPYPIKHRNEGVRLAAFAAQGIEIIQTEPQIIESIFVDRGVEAVLATQMLSDTLGQATPPERVVLISRRAALAPVVEALLAAGTPVCVAYFTFEIAPENPLALSGVERVDLSADLVKAHRLNGPQPPSIGPTENRSAR